MLSAIKLVSRLPIIVIRDRLADRRWREVIFNVARELSGLWIDFPVVSAPRLQEAEYVQEGDSNESR